MPLLAEMQKIYRSGSSENQLLPALIRPVKYWDSYIRSVHGIVWTGMTTCNQEGKIYRGLQRLPKYCPGRAITSIWCIHNWRIHNRSYWKGNHGNMSRNFERRCMLYKPTQGLTRGVVLNWGQTFPISKNRTD